MGAMRRNPEEIARMIMAADTIAVCSHVCPDGDTLGSAAAMKIAISKLGKKVSLFCDGKVPDQLSFLPGIDEMKIPTGDEGPFDLMLSVDVSDEKRLGACEKLILRSKHTAQIDHHPTNPLFMEVNSVDGQCPASCILIREHDAPVSSGASPRLLYSRAPHLFHLPFSGSSYISHSFTRSSVLSSHPHPMAGSDFFVRYSFAEHLQYATDKNRIQGDIFYKTGFLQKIFLRNYEKIFFMHVSATDAYRLLCFSAADIACRLIKDTNKNFWFSFQRL